MKNQKWKTRLAALLCAGFIMSGTAHAATFTVTSTADTSDGTCDANCTLREAITAANVAVDADTITFDASVFATLKVIMLNSALPRLTSEMTVTGPGLGVTIKGDTNHSFRIFEVLRATVIFSGLTISGGATGVVNDGSLTLINCTLSQNTSNGIANVGGQTTVINCTLSSNHIGIYNSDSRLTATNCIIRGNNYGISQGLDSSMTVTDCVISDNLFEGINNSRGRMTVNNCIINGNAKGITNFNLGGLTATNCTISGNDSGIENKSTGNITNCTINHNAKYGLHNISIAIHLIQVINCTISGNAEGIRIESGTVKTTNCTVSGNTSFGVNKIVGTATLKNTLVAGNATNTQGTITAGGYNILTGTAAQAGLEVNSNGQPILKDNGGPTKTIALVKRGAAVNAGRNALIPDGITTDQRGPSYLRIIGETVDIGSYESEFPHGVMGVNNTRTFKEGSATAPGLTTFTISLAAPDSQSVTVNYQTADGTAKAGSDYVAKSGALTFAPGETVKYVRVEFIGDSIAEANETFFLDLKTPVNATLSDSRGSAYIRNDDGPSLTIDNAVTLDEGNAGTHSQTFVVRLSAASTQTVTVKWSTANGTAGPADYVAQSGTLTFAPGETAKTITVQVKGDTVVEPNETYKVNLSSPTYAVITDSQGVAYIRNDDASALHLEDPPSS